jgi:hypothetical protein
MLKYGYLDKFTYRFVLINSHSRHRTATHQTCIHLNESETSTISSETRVVLIQLSSIPRPGPQEGYLLLEGVGLGERDGAPAVLVTVQQPLHPLLGTVLPVEVLHLPEQNETEVSRETEKRAYRVRGDGVEAECVPRLGGSCRRSWRGTSCNRRGRGAPCWRSRLDSCPRASPRTRRRHLAPCRAEGRSANPVSSRKRVGERREWAKVKEARVYLVAGFAPLGEDVRHDGSVGAVFVGVVGGGGGGGHRRLRSGVGFVCGFPLKRRKGYGWASPKESGPTQRRKWCIK